VLRRLALYLARHPAKPADQEIAQVPPTAVHGEDVQVMDVDVAVEVRLAHLLGIEAVQPISAVDGGKDVIVEPLKREAHVRVLVDPPVKVLEIAFDQLVGVDQGANVAQLAVEIAIEDIRLGRLGMPVLDQRALHQVLDLLHRGDLVGAVALVQHLDHGVGDKQRALLVIAPDSLRGLENGVGDLVLVKGHDAAITLLHGFDKTL